MWPFFFFACFLFDWCNRYVNGIGSDLEQMQYLIDHAAQARDKLGLKLGVSLSAEQVAALDSSILWWENAVIDGQNVLVPKLYISPKDVVVNNGSMIAGNQTILNAGNIINDGSTLQGKTLLSASSQNAIGNINGGAINSGGSLQLSALGDINNVSSTISGQKVALESVSGQIVNKTSANIWDAANVGKGWNRQGLEFVQTDLGALASINATDSLILNAGTDILVTGASLSAGSNMALKAQNNIVIESNQLVERERRGSNLNENITQQGSSITSGGKLNLQAGRDIAVKASSLYAEDNVGLQAGNHLLVKGSSVVGDGNVALNAGHNVDIVAATDTDSAWHFKETKKSGLMGTGGIGFTIGSSKSTHDLREQGTTQSQSISTVGSTGGNVSVNAGGMAHIGGADLVAGKGLSVAGDSVLIEPGHDKRTRDERFEQKSTGLTVALSGAVGDAINNAVETAQATAGWLHCRQRKRRWQVGRRILTLSRLLLLQIQTMV